MGVHIVKDSEKYKVVDVRTERCYIGDYQLIEKVTGYSAVCGVFSRKKDALEKLNLLETKK